MAEHPQDPRPEQGEFPAASAWVALADTAGRLLMPCLSPRPPWQRLHTTSAP